MRTSTHTQLSKHFLALCLLIASMVMMNSAYANGGGKEAGGGAPVARLEPFVVNLSSFDKYLQTIITLKVGAAEVVDKIKSIMPIVRHTVIMTLSSKEQSDVQTAEGKKELIEELREKINKAIDAKEHEGVSEVFFENFVIQ